MTKTKTCVVAVEEGLLDLAGEREPGRVGLSSTFRCLRGQGYEALGLPQSDPPDAGAMVAFETGHAMEEVVIRAMERGGLTVSDRQRHVNLFVGHDCADVFPARVCEADAGGARHCGADIPAGCVPGHLDGTLGRGAVVVDAKAYAECGVKKLVEDGAPDDSYFGKCQVGQLTAYLAALKAEGEPAEYAKIVAVNKAASKGGGRYKLPAVVEVDIDYDPALAAEATAFWRAVAAQKRAGAVIDRPFTRDSLACRYCSQESRCWGGAR